MGPCYETRSASDFGARVSGVVARTGTRRVDVNDDSNTLIITNGTQLFTAGDSVLLSSDSQLPGDVNGPLLQRAFVTNVTGLTLQLSRTPHGRVINLVKAGNGIIRIHRSFDILEMCFPRTSVATAYDGRAHVWTPLMHAGILSSVSADVAFGIACNADGQSFSDVDVQPRLRHGNQNIAKIHAGLSWEETAWGHRGVLSVASEHQADAEVAMFADFRVFTCGGDAELTTAKPSQDSQVRIIAPDAQVAYEVPSTVSMG